MPTERPITATALPIEAQPTSILAAPYRAATLGMVALVSLNAFESLAVAAAMPTVARELNGLPLYALAFGGALATSVIGMTAAGRWSDRRGPGGALAAACCALWSACWSPAWHRACRC